MPEGKRKGALKGDLEQEKANLRKEYAYLVTVLDRYIKLFQYAATRCAEWTKEFPRVIIEEYTQSSLHQRCDSLRRRIEVLNDWVSKKLQNL
jgi:hypothetical protein